MGALRRFLRRLVNAVKPDRAETDLSRELASHLVLLEDEYRRRGMPAADAHRAARVALGGIERTKELHRAARSLSWLDDARRDAGYAARMLARAPGFTSVAVLTLALGIGAVTIIYSVIHSVLLDPLPYPGAERFVNVEVRARETGQGRASFGPDEFLDYQEQTSAFDAVVGTAGETMMFATRDAAELLRGVWVTPNFFEVMGIAPSIGRVNTAGDAKPDAPMVAVLRHRAWVNFFGSDPGVVGRTVVLNGKPFVVIGVMPPRFTWHAADVWIPAAIARDRSDRPAPARSFQARLRPGTTLEQAEAELNLIASRRAREHPADYPDSFTIRVINVIDSVIGDFRAVLYTTLAAVSLLLLIACCNVASMLLARGTAREREMTVRAALGAGRGRIIRQLLVESVLLALAGASIGCVLAYVGVDALVPLIPPNPLPGEVEFALDRSALAFSLGMAVLSALLFGIAPAMYGARRDLVEGLKNTGKSIAGGRGRTRNAIVTLEIALSLVLLLGAGLLMRSFVTLVRVDLGFNPRNLLVVSAVFPPGAYTTPPEKNRFYEQALERIASMPGIASVAATTGIPPFYGPYSNSLEILGRQDVTDVPSFVQLCNEGYFRTLGIRLIRGRGLSGRGPAELPAEAVVNQRLVDTYFKGEDAVGRQIRVMPVGRPPDPAFHGVFEIVGVVEDMRNRGLNAPPGPHVYLPGADAGRVNAWLLVRTVTDPSVSLNAIRIELGRLDRQVAIRPTRLDETLQRVLYAQPRFSLIVFGVFAATGTLLVAIGIFSVMAYTVSRQTRDIAVRMALGAERRDVLRVILGAAARLIAAGVAGGILASFATSRAIGNQLWNVSPHDPLTLASAIVLITIVALAACLIPARRAMRIDPISALRHD